MKLIKETTSKLKYGYYHKFAIFECSECGNEFEHNISDITSGRKRNCGCKWVLKPLPNDIKGVKILNDLGVIDGRRNAVFECPLCFKPFSSKVDNIKAKCAIVHCGCYVKPIKEKPIKIKKERKLVEQREVNHPLHTTWKGMKNRCYHTKDNSYKNYGLLGIRVCDEWLKSFKTFVKDMGDKPTIEHTLDRINPLGNYEPSNCRWASREQQASNKRKNTSNDGV